MHNRGFTIIEFVTVLVLIGALAVVALPRYIDLQDEAYTASSANVSGALQSGVRLIRSQWAAQGQGTTVTEGGVTIPVNAAGWPVPQPASNSGCATLWDQVLASAPPVVTTLVIGDSGWFAFPFAGGCGYILQADTTPVRLVVYPTTTGGNVLGEPIVAGNVLFIEI